MGTQKHLRRGVHSRTSPKNKDEGRRKESASAKSNPLVPCPTARERILMWVRALSTYSRVRSTPSVRPPVHPSAREKCRGKPAPGRTPHTRFGRVQSSGHQRRGRGSRELRSSWAKGLDRPTTDCPGQGRGEDYPQISAGTTADCLVRAQSLCGREKLVGLDIRFGARF